MSGECGNVFGSHSGRGKHGAERVPGGMGRQLPHADLPQRRIILFFPETPRGKRLSVVPAEDGISSRIDAGFHILLNFRVDGNDAALSGFGLHAASQRPVGFIIGKAGERQKLRDSESGVNHTQYVIRVFHAALSRSLNLRYLHHQEGVLLLFLGLGENEKGSIVFVDNIVLHGIIKKLREQRLDFGEGAVAHVGIAVDHCLKLAGADILDLVLFDALQLDPAGIVIVLRLFGDIRVGNGFPFLKELFQRNGEFWNRIVVEGLHGSSGFGSGFKLSQIHPQTFPFIGVSRGGISDPRFFLAVVALVHAAGAVGVFVGFSALGNRRFSAERAEGKLFGKLFSTLFTGFGHKYPSSGKEIFDTEGEICYHNDRPRPWVLVYSLLSPPSGCLATADGGGVFIYFFDTSQLITAEIVSLTIYEKKAAIR